MLQILFHIIYKGSKKNVIGYIRENIIKHKLGHEKLKKNQNNEQP